MGAGSLQLISVFQESLTETPAQQANANTTPLNPSQAQGAAVPQDTRHLDRSGCPRSANGTRPSTANSISRNCDYFRGSADFSSHQ